MLQKFLAPLREFGPLIGVLYGVDRVLERISPRLRLMSYDLVAQPIPATPILPERFARSFAIRSIERGAAELSRMPPPADVIDARFAQGAECLGAFRHDELVAYLWFCRGRYDEDEVRCVYVLGAPQSVFDFDVYVFPEHRAGFAFAALWNGVNAYLRARGIEWSLSRIASANLASQRAHARFGTHRLGRVLFLKLWTLEVMVGSVSPYFGVTLRRRIRLRLLP